MPFTEIQPALPEIFLAAMAMVLLMVGVFRGENATRLVMILSIITMAVAIGLVAGTNSGATQGFNGLFVADGFARFSKILILIASIAGLLLSLGYIEREGMARFEYPVLIVLATLGMSMMVSANDLISLYLGLELQSLSLYVIASFQRETVKSTEAGLKYFVLGALSSGMLLYGMSMVYGFSGSTGFEALAELFGRAEGGAPSLGLLVGMVFIIAGLAFKVSAVPFHMWTPDVYEGAPTPVAALFAIGPKIAAIALFVRVMMDPFGSLVDQWRQILIFLSIASMALGAFAAIAQTNIKRLMAYSSIGHVGYVLVGLSAGVEQGVSAVMIYMAIYLFMNAGVFACILAMRRNGRMVESISDLAGLGRSNPVVAACFLMFLFSMAGIPPLAGFFGKFYVFLAAVEAGLHYLALIGFLLSVIGAYYYIRIIRVMYFDDVAEALDRPIGRDLSTVLVVSSLVTALFFVYQDPIVNGAGDAARTLVAG